MVPMVLIFQSFFTDLRNKNKEISIIFQIMTCIFIFCVIDCCGFSLWEKLWKKL